MLAWIVAASTCAAARMRSGVVLAAPAAAGPPCGAGVFAGCALGVPWPSAAIASAAIATERIDLACEPMRLIMCYLVAIRVGIAAADRPAGRLGAHHHAALGQAQSMFGCGTQFRCAEFD